MGQVPAPRWRFGGVIRATVAIPLVLVLVVAGVLVWHLTSAGQGGSARSGPPLPAGPVDARQLAAREEAGLLYPGATGVVRRRGTLRGIGGQDPFSAGMLPGLVRGTRAARLVGISTRSVAPAGVAEVARWYDRWLRGHGWCAPSRANKNASIPAYVRGRREAFALIDLPVSRAAAGRGVGDTTAVNTWYVVFPPGSTLPSC